MVHTHAYIYTYLKAKTNAKVSTTRNLESYLSSWNLIAPLVCNLINILTRRIVSSNVYNFANVYYIVYSNEDERGEGKVRVIHCVKIYQRNTYEIHIWNSVMNDIYKYPKNCPRTFVSRGRKVELHFPFRFRKCLYYTHK